MTKYNNRTVEVDDLVIVAESVKCFGIVPSYIINNEIEHREVTHYTQIKDRLSTMIIWLPKSRITEYDIYQGDMFPNLNIKFGMKERPDCPPYKSMLKCKIEEWLVGKNKLLEGSNPF